ncbi:MAG: aminoacyl-tRNA hydrolase [Gammaproteobacteria bacterium]|nr:aminoacyl-tRNA hydrolase [Gammaproteobacteria bacterium]
MDGDAVLRAIVGLGNPGPKHAEDRHNAGFWFVDRIAAGAGEKFREESRFSGALCQASFAGHSLRLAKPSTFMNRSGQCVRKLMDFYQLAPDSVLVVHDDVDLPLGSARFKLGGGHGGNNGLRDIIANCGADFYRLRLGVGHPGQSVDVADYVLHPPGRAEQSAIDYAAAEALRALDIWFAQGFQRAVTYLHTATPRDAAPGPAG